MGAENDALLSRAFESKAADTVPVWDITERTVAAFSPPLKQIAETCEELALNSGAWQNQCGVFPNEYIYLLHYVIVYMLVCMVTSNTIWVSTHNEVYSIEIQAPES